MSKKETLVKTDKIGSEWWVSICLPISPREGQKNRLLLKQLMFEAEKRLLELGLTPLNVAGMLLPIELLLDKAEFWQTQKESLTLFLTPTSFVRLAGPSQAQEPVVEATPLI